MSETHIRVIAHFTVKADKVDAFIRTSREALVIPSRKESGCIQYDLWQDASNPARFAMVEEWESNEALDTHLSLKSMQTAVARLTPMGEDRPTVQRLRSVTSGA